MSNLAITNSRGQVKTVINVVHYNREQLYVVNCHLRLKFWQFLLYRRSFVITVIVKPEFHCKFRKYLSDITPSLLKTDTVAGVTCERIRKTFWQRQVRFRRTIFEGYPCLPLVTTQWNLKRTFPILLGSLLK